MRFVGLDDNRRDLSRLVQGHFENGLDVIVDGGNWQNRQPPISSRLVAGLACAGTQVRASTGISRNRIVTTLDDDSGAPRAAPAC
jgi:hypothetical protein